MTQTDEERKTLLRQAYSTATQKLRESRRTEFNQMYAEEAEKLGVVWSPRQTAEQKAEQTFDELLAEFPHLKERLAQDA
jgi:ABC-type branched-subunit amino acid transport system ATPase component